MYRFKSYIFLLISINFFFTSLNLKSAELIFEVGGKFHVTHFYQIDPNYNFMTIKNTWTMTTNTPYVGYGNCSGTIKTKSQKQVYDLVCHGKFKEGEFYAAFDYSAKGDVQSASTSEYTFLSGSGPWKELVGIKCLGALIQLGEENYIWRGKCNVSDNTFNRFINYKVEE